jgi:chloramphenicol-sensitive protein RarD
MNTGTLYAIGAYILWGISPIYWKQLTAVTPFQVVIHRVIWTFLLAIFILLVTRQLNDLREEIRQPKVLRTYFIASILIGSSWVLFVWAVNAGYIIESSLGYFINPLISVMMGVIILREKIRPWQWVPVGLAAAGVLYLTISYGQFPWIALSLAGIFALYGLVKKSATLKAAHGLALESAFLLLPALGWLIYLTYQGESAFTNISLTTDLFLIGSGAATIAPLLLFASAAQKIPLSMIGLLQYFAPTLQLLIGVLIYNEAFPTQKLVGYSLVWVGLVIFWLEGWLNRRSKTIQTKEK